MQHSMQVVDLLGGDSVEAAVQELGSLEDKLLVLRLSLGKLRAAFERAFAPIAATILPPITQAVQAITGFVNDAAAVISALFGHVREDATQTIRVTGSAIKRSLASFDQLERLNGRSGSGSSVVTVPGQIQKLPERLRPIVEKIQSLLKPLQEIDFSAAEAAFARLKAAIEPISRQLFSGLEWVWFNILVPIAQWGAEQALPAFLDALTAALGLVNSAIEAAKPALSWLWNNLLVPLGQWAGQTVINALNSLTEKLQMLSAWLSGCQNQAGGFTDKMEGLKGSVSSLGSQFGIFNGISQTLTGGMSRMTDLAGQLKSGFSGMASSLTQAKNTMSNLFTNLSPTFRTLANGAVGILNTALNAIENGINAMVRTLNGYKVTIPNWVPGIGGKSVGMSLKTVDLPQIPYLAKGAVLPANKPFLAMVGDQRHGTNIEAPLSTIQEAVAEVLGSSLSGQERGNALLQSILAAIEGITLGDEVIGRAARRYEDRMAVMGGVL